MNVIGYLGGKNGEINPILILQRRVVVRGIPVGSRESFEAMNRAITLHHMRPVVDKVFPWIDVGEALRFLKSAKHFGKVVLRMG